MQFSGLFWPPPFCHIGERSLSGCPVWSTYAANANAIYGPPIPNDSMLS